MTAFSIFCMIFGLEASDERASLFSAQTLRNPTLIKTTLLSIVTIIVATELHFFQSLLKTTSLNLTEWAICLGVGASVIIVAEAWKFVIRRRPERASAAEEPAAEAVPKRPTRPVATGG
jgi:Ca2+-transporting ATPase